MRVLVAGGNRADDAPIAHDFARDGPYVVSDVTTLTLPATGARTGGGVTGT